MNEASGAPAPAATTLRKGSLIRITWPGGESATVRITSDPAPSDDPLLGAVTFDIEQVAEPPAQPGAEMRRSTLSDGWIVWADGAGEPVGAPWYVPGIPRDDQDADAACPDDRRAQVPAQAVRPAREAERAAE